MLQPPSITTTMPLFSNEFYLATSPYGAQDRLPRTIIKPTRCEILSFEWTDFPSTQEQASIADFPLVNDIDEADQEKRQSNQEIEPQHCFCKRRSTKSENNTIRREYSSTLQVSSSRPSSIKPKPRKQKRVCFSDTLQIRTHSLVLGDHPYCPILAVELGWEYNDEEKVQLERYEQNKPRKIRKRSYIERRNILAASGIETYDSHLCLKESAPPCDDLADWKND